MQRSLKHLSLDHFLPDLYDVIILYVNYIFLPPPPAPSLPSPVLITSPRLGFNSQSSRLTLVGARITSTHHCAQLHLTCVCMLSCLWSRVEGWGQYTCVYIHVEVRGLTACSPF